MVRRLFKLLFVLALLGFAGLAGYAFLGDLSPDLSEQNHVVTLDAN